MLTVGQVAALRRDAESLMRDTFAAFAPGTPVVDANGMKQPGWTPMGTTQGKTQAGSAAGRDTTTRTVTVGGSERDVVDGGLHIPVGAFVDTDQLLLRIGWELQCTAIGPATDPAALGRRYQVVGAPSKSWMTARRLDVVQVPSLTLT